MSSPVGSDLVEPFPIVIPKAGLLDLRRRLSATRRPDRETVPDAGQGPQLDRIRALCDHWATGYDRALRPIQR